MRRHSRFPVAITSTFALSLTIAPLASGCGSEPPPQATAPATAPVAVVEPEPAEPTAPAKSAPGPWPTFERPATAPAMKPDGSVANVDTVVNGMGSDLNRCYQRELAENSTSRGSVRLRVQIEPRGDVNSVQLLSQTGNLSAALLRCVAKVVGSRWFLGVGTGATLELPLTLAPDVQAKDP